MHEDLLGSKKNWEKFIFFDLGLVAMRILRLCDNFLWGKFDFWCG